MKAHGPKRNSSRQGGALLSVVIALILVSILGASMAGMLYRTGHGQAQSYDLARARYLAESGINFARTASQLDVLTNTGPVTVMFDAREQFTVSVEQTNGLYHIEAVGSTGIGTGRETHQKITRSRMGLLPWDPDTAPPGVEVSTVVPIVEEFVVDSVSTWKQQSLGGFKVLANSSDGSGVDAWMESAGLNATDYMFFDWNAAGTWDHYVGLTFMVMNKLNSLGSAWFENDHQISYDVQIKMMWDYDRWYGAQGLALMVYNGDRHLTDWKTDSYNVSLMRYANDAELGDYNATFDYTYDGIPNGIKPPGLAGHRLLVLWVHENSANRVEWIAYKDLDNYTGLPGEDTVDWIVDWNDGVSGQCFRDYATLAARVIEARVTDSLSYRYLQVLRADPKTGIARAANTVGADINRNRKAYLPIQYGGTFPEWSPLDFNAWNEEQDYFTYLGGSSETSLQQIQWDGVNTNSAAPFVVMPDQGTIRIADHETPNKGNWNRNRWEIGMAVSGNFNNTMANKIYFDEFAVRFLNNSYEGTEVPGVQY